MRISLLGVLIAAATSMTSTACAVLGCGDKLGWRAIPTDTTLRVGEQFTAGMEITTCWRVSHPLYWSSNDSTIARVDPVTGVVQARSPGSTRLIAVDSILESAFAGTSVTVRAP